MPKVRAFLASRWGRVAVLVTATVSVYALLGFALVPWILADQLAAQITERAGLRAEVEDVDANPFFFTVTVEGFVVGEPEREPMLRISRLFVDFELSSIVRGAWIFREVTIEGPRLRVSRRPEGSFDVLDVVSQMTSGGPEDASDATETADDAMVALVVERFALREGKVTYRDETHLPAFETELAPISFDLRDFDTRPGAPGRHAFRARSEAGETVAWSGRLSMEPLVATGSVSVADLRLPKYRPYLSRVVPVRATRGRLGAGVEYRLALEPEGASARLSNGHVEVDDLAARLDGAKEDFVEVGSARVRGASLSWPDRRARIDEVQVSGGRLAVSVGPDGRTNLDQLIGSTGTSTAGVSSSRSDEASPIAFSLGSAEVAAFRLDGRHVTPAGIVPMRLEVERGNLRGLTLPPGETSTVGVDLALVVARGGRVEVGAEIGLAPLQARSRVRVAELDLSPFAPYLASMARLELASGRLSLAGTAQVVANPDGELDGGFAGELQIDELSTIDTLKRLDFVRWRRLAVEEAELALRPPSLRVASVEIDRPYARVSIREDRSTNLGDIFPAAPAKPRSARAPPPEGPPAEFRIGSVRIRGGAADFEDRSVAPRFATSIQQLRGRIDDLSSTALGRGRVRLAGQVDRYAPVRIAGNVHLFSTRRPTTLALDFENLEMTTLTPYAARFAGHVIEKGKLNVELAYTLRGPNLEGRNQVRVDQLTLGDRVESPDAVKLPVKLAIALMKNKDGRIEIDLPVSGSLDDPEFRVGKLVWKAVVNLMEKAALSPFKALGGLFASKGDHAEVPFVVGTSTTGPAAARDLRALESALFERRALVLEIDGRWDPQGDRRAIAEAQLDALLDELALRSDLPDPGSDPAADPPGGALVREAHRRAFSPAGSGAPEDAAARPPRLRDRVLQPRPEGAPSTEPPAPGATLELDALRAELIDALEPEVTQEALRGLALARAEAVRDVILTAGRVEPERVFVLEPGPSDGPVARLRLNAR